MTILFLSQIAICHLAYFLSLKFKKGDLADLIWTIFVFSWSAFYISQSIVTNRNLIIFSLTAIWFARMFYLIFKHRILGKGEDSRYATFRKNWSNKGVLKLNFYILFITQIFMAYILSFAFRYMYNVFDKLAFVEIIGIIVFVVSFTGLYISDWQLKQFRKEARKNPNLKQVCNTGLWKTSRHPNYFFEFCLWCSYPFFCVYSGNFLLSLTTPFTMFVLLYFITGVPPSEKQALKSRGEAYREYQKTTNKFFPNFFKLFNKN